MHINLRPLRPDDRANLANLLIRIPQFDAEDLAVAMELIDAAIQKPNLKDYRFILAENGLDQIVGYICFGPTPLTDRVFCLYWIGVDSAHSGCGIGSEMLLEMENALSAQGARIIFLETSSDPLYNRTRQFYLKHGYRLTETFSNFFQEGEDRLTYTKRLSG